MVPEKINRKKVPEKITEKTGTENNFKINRAQKAPSKKQSYEYKENNKKKFWNSQMDYQKRTIW